jgi:hypothetical protein
MGTNYLDKSVKLLHYGLQRSGTNFLESLLAKKYRVQFLNSNIDGIRPDRSSPLHKHFRLYDEKDIVPEPKFRNEYKIASLADFEKLLEVVPDYYLIISKDPYSWYLSYKEWARRSNWEPVPYHYILEYNLFYAKWLELSRQTNKILFVRYIDLLREPDEELKRLETAMHLKKKFLYTLRSNVVFKVPQSAEFSIDRRSYYLSEQYLQSYTKEGLKEINNLLDLKVLSRLGYQKKEKDQ